MSDRIEDWPRNFAENLWEENARSIGLFPIPEYPELEERGMWSTVLNIFLTTLRYLAPATLLTLFWGQPNFLFKLLKYIDSSFRSVVFSTEEQKHEVLQWLADAGPVRVDKLDVVWRQGWIICGVLDTALPGACAGHPPSRLSVKHAQTIAEQYLGVEPVFTHEELEDHETLSKHQEWKLIKFLDSIRVAISKLTPPCEIQTTTKGCRHLSKPMQNTLDYIARGSGLAAVQINNKVSFNIYPTAQQSIDPSDITISIRGPRGTCGVTVVPPILGKAQLIRQSLRGMQSNPNFTESALPITLGTTYMRTYGKSYINKTFFIPKSRHDIEIEVEIKQDHARVSYVAKIEGKHEISITSKGQNIIGSPFKATASCNIIKILEKDNLCLEDGEEINIVDIKTDKKVVLKIVDYGNEKMLLKEDGVFQKIAEDEAQNLMVSNKKRFSNNHSSRSSIPDQITKNVMKHKQVLKKFFDVVHKVLIMNRVCKVLYALKEEKILVKKINLSKTKKDIPDIVNSTFYDDQSSPTLPETKQRIIIPDSISVSILTEKPKRYVDEVEIVASNSNIQFPSDTLENIRTFKEDLFEDVSVSVDTMQTTNNPFLSEIYDQNYEVGKKFGSFVQNEYEANNSQSEATEDSVGKLLDNIHHEDKKPNPFLDLTNENLERPLTIFKKLIPIDSIYDDSENDNTSVNIIHGTLKNNPFIEHAKCFSQQRNDRPDFIIGAPVSIPSAMFSSSNENKTKSIEITETKYKNSDSELQGLQNECMTDSFLTVKNVNQMDSELKNSNYDSLDSNNSSKITFLETSREMSPKTDIWDSAYVSIDDNIYAESTLSDSSNERTSNEKLHLQTRTNLRDITYIDEDHEILKHERKRTEITPIIEENEKSVSFGMRDEPFATDSVMTAFAELDDIYDDIFINSEASSETTTQDHKLQNLEIDYVTENDEVCVNSASDIITDVKRQTKQIEGKISEVQPKVTESVSVSQNLHVKRNYCEENNNLIGNETQFGDQTFLNIVSQQKKYWDEKIRQIEATSEEIKTFKSKRRLSCKHLRRNDSLSKRRGKKIVQHFLTSGQEECEKYTKNRSESISDDIQNIEIHNSATVQDIDDKKVEKLTCFGKTTSQNKKQSVIDTFKQIKVSNEDLVDVGSLSEEKNTDSNSKQELSEKVFQAFETSPKRFFGTSRKHILNKIDTFLGLPNNEQESKKIITDINHENGLVSSRISLFHNISNTEELPWARRKSKSMFNINSGSGTLKMQIEPKPLSTKVLQVDEVNNIESNGSRSILSSNINTNPEISQEHHKTFKEKQTRLAQNNCNISFDETTSCSVNKELHNIKTNNTVRKTIKDLNKQNNQSTATSSVKKLKSISKSEMDIFSRISNTIKDDGLDKHKSYEELPKISVKNFISHYEDVTKSSNQSRKTSKLKSVDSSKKSQVRDSFPDTDQTSNTLSTQISTSDMIRTKYPNEHKITTATKGETNNDYIKFEALDSRYIKNSSKSHETLDQEKENTFLSLSDIEVEIIENDPDKSVEPDPTPEGEVAHLEYKNRFTMAKKYFQSLEELRPDISKKCTKKELLHSRTSIESLEDNSRPKKRSNIKKSMSMPSSEIAKIWNEMQEQKGPHNSKKLVKISEKFHVDDLFEDVMEGRLSRQGSLRGIPNKKAVLETFRSMENVSGNKLNSYDMAVDQSNDIAYENHARNAQTYLNEYPYLPTTDPSKYYSRLDANASGLITFKELKKIPRRNSVPDLRLNPTFTADL